MKVEWTWNDVYFMLQMAFSCTENAQLICNRNAHTSGLAFPFHNTIFAGEIARLGLSLCIKGNIGETKKDSSTAWTKQSRLKVTAADEDTVPSFICKVKNCFMFYRHLIMSSKRFISLCICGTCLAFVESCYHGKHVHVFDCFCKPSVNLHITSRERPLWCVFTKPLKLCHLISPAVYFVFMENWIWHH